MMKKSLDEHINRMKYLTDYSGKGKKNINEQTPVQTQPAQGQQPTQPAAQPAQQGQQPNIDQQLDQLLNNPQLDQELNSAMATVTKTLPADLTNIAKTTGDRDGQLEVQEQELRVDEGLMMVAGTVLAAPKIIELMGKGLSKTGVKVSSQTLQKWGEKLSHFGHAIHGKYIGVIEGILKPMTGYMDDKQRHALAGTLLTMIVAGFGVASVAGAVHAIQAGHAVMASAEGGLSLIKAAEIAEKVSELLPSALAATAK